MSAIELQDLSKRYISRGSLKKKEQWAVAHVSLRIEQGTIFGFLGPNGAGKTTTIKMMMGLARPTSGRIFMLSEDIALKNIRKTIGFLPENLQFPPTLTAREILAWSGKMMGLHGNSLKGRVENLLKQVLLFEDRNKKIAAFSRGMVQRLGIAQALIGCPKILILDEPLSGLDPPGRQMVSSLLKSEREKGTTVFFSSHILSDIQILCDEVALIVKGRLKGKGGIGDVFGISSNAAALSLDQRFVEVVADA